MCCKRGAQARHEGSEHERGGAHAEESRAPPANDPDREHDRQRLDRFDSAGEEGGQEEDDVVAHSSAAW